MRAIEIKAWMGSDLPAWLWHECGDGRLERVKHVSDDCWVSTVARGNPDWMTSSWCCHWGSIFYIGTDDEAVVQEEVLRCRLTQRRERWNAEAAAK